MSMVYELHKHVDDALCKRHLFEVCLGELRYKYELCKLSQLANLELNNIDVVK